ncbi:MAG: hypothetical protein GTO30_09480 [Acidobacteria bacterium]|nr:hypothetical protein [Acidobacteriota bacterium]NIO60823.1 hypothetical protein [Acidobacteriota bacterium]
MIVGLVGLIGASNHELWRDEAEPWLIGRDSATPADLLVSMSTQGHPALWYSITWTLSKITHDPWIMQGFNLLLAATMAWLVGRHAPFPRWVRVLFCLSYYPIFEFTVLNRAYMSQLLLATAVCVLWTRRDKMLWWIALLLALLSQTIVYGAIMASGLVLALSLLSLNREDPLARLPLSAKLGPLALALAGIGGGAGYAYWQAKRMVAHLGTYEPTYDFEWIAAAVSTLMRGALPLPDPGSPDVWNTNIVDALGAGAPLAGLLGGLGFVGLAVWPLRRSLPLVVAFLFATGAMFTITAVMWHGQQRHHAQPFVFWWIVLWIAVASGVRWTSRHSQVLGVLLALHCVAAAWLLATDARRPFSHARNVAALLETDEWREHPVIGHVDFATEPIAVWLDRPLYYVEQRRFGTFMDWSFKRKDATTDFVIRDAIRMARDEGREVMLVLNYGGNVELGHEMAVDGAVMRHTHRFEGAIVPDENYYLYVISPVDP